jgi:hypothetical protein
MDIAAGVLLRDYMLDMKPVEGLIVLMDPTVLAPLACPAPD